MQLQEAGTGRTINAQCTCTMHSSHVPDVNHELHLTCHKSHTSPSHVYTYHTSPERKIACEISHPPCSLPASAMRHASLLLALDSFVLLLGSPEAGQGVHELLLHLGRVRVGLGVGAGVRVADLAAVLDLALALRLRVEVVLGLDLGLVLGLDLGLDLGLLDLGLDLGLELGLDLGLLDLDIRLHLRVR